ncbi:MAG: hypothetical protein QM589_04225 [Thermomicrobiales bacterium]
MVVTVTHGHVAAGLAVDWSIIMYLVWFDPDKRRSIHTKLDDAVAVYQEKFGDDPDICLVNEADREALLAAASSLPVPLRSERFVSRNTFYVGHDERPAEEPGEDVAA